MRRGARTLALAAALLAPVLAAPAAHASFPGANGRIAFSRLGDDTLLHLSMNYAPPLGRLASLLSPALRE